MQLYKSVDIYLRQGTLYFQSLTKMLPHGPSVVNAHLEVLAFEDTNQHLGSAFLKALQNSNSSNRYPDNFQPGSTNVELLKMMKVKTWNALAFPDTKVVHCSLSEEGFTLTPTKSNREGKRARGFRHKNPEDDIKLSRDSGPEVLGLAIRDAFERSE